MTDPASSFGSPNAGWVKVTADPKSRNYFTFEPMVVGAPGRYEGRRGPVVGRASEFGTGPKSSIAKTASTTTRNDRFTMTLPGCGGECWGFSGMRCLILSRRTAEHDRGT
jgi:hypothetical protein